MSEQSPRLALVAHIREQIEAGTYITQKKLEIVVDRIASQLQHKTDEGVDSLTKRPKP
jgi:hypothetical protein